MILAVTVVHAPIRFRLPLLAMITSSLAYKSIQWDNFKASTRFRKLGQFYAGFRNRATALSGPTVQPRVGRHISGLPSLIDMFADERAYPSDGPLTFRDKASRQMPEMPHAFPHFACHVNTRVARAVGESNRIAEQGFIITDLDQHRG